MHPRKCMDTFVNTGVTRNITSGHATICCVYYGGNCKPCYISSPHICVSLDLRDIFQVHYSFLEIHLRQIFVLYLQKIRINSSRHPDIHKRTEKSLLSLTARWDLHA